MWEFLTFRRMVTPVLIQILFWLAEIAVVALAISMIVGGGAGQLPILPPEVKAHVPAVSRGLGILVLILGPILVRVFFEILIVTFRINDSLTDIARNTEAMAESRRP